MKIVHVVNHFMPDLGYTEYYLAKKQSELGHDVRVISSDRNFYTPSNAAITHGLSVEEGVKVIRLPVLFELSGNIFILTQNQLKKVLTDFSPDVVHIHGATSPLAFNVALCTNSIKCKIVADVITGMVIAKGFSKKIKTSLLQLYSRTLWPYLFNKISCFFGCSEGAITWMISQLNINRENIHFVPLGADDTLFHFDSEKRSLIRAKLGIKNSDVVAIYTGKFVPLKKIDTLFYAIAPIIKNNPELKVLLVGKGPASYVRTLKTIIDYLDLADNVIFHDDVHRTELSSFYSAADFAVWPGHHSVSMIEAMATRLPIILADSDWTNHLVAFNNGFVYPEGNVSALREQIFKLSTNKVLRQEMGKRSQELVENQLNWKTIAKKYLEVYDSVLS